MGFFEVSPSTCRSIFQAGFEDVVDMVAGAPPPFSATFLRRVTTSQSCSCICILCWMYNRMSYRYSDFIFVNEHVVCSMEEGLQTTDDRVQLAVNGFQGARVIQSRDVVVYGAFVHVIHERTDPLT